MRTLRTLSLGPLLILLSCTPTETPERQSAGVVVESVTPGSAGAMAGLRSGDVILSWSCGDSKGTVHSPYDLLPLEIEEAPRRGVLLRGKRKNQEIVWTLRQSEWGIEARPRRPDEHAGGDGRLAAWFLHRQAKASADAEKWAEADSAYRDAVAMLERESDRRAAAELLRNWGRSFQRRGDLSATVDRYQRALALDRRGAPKSLAAARTLTALGVTLMKKGDYPGAERVLRQALATGEELAPWSSEVAASLEQLGVLARLRGDLKASKEHLVRAEEIQRRLAPASTGHARSLLELGILAQKRGDLNASENLCRRALAILEKTAPASEAVAGCWYNLARVAYQRGDLATTDDRLRRLQAVEKKASDELERSRTFLLLGHLAMDRGDHETAEAYYRRGLTIQERIAPEGKEAAASLGSLGGLALVRRDFVTARTYLLRSLAIEEKLAPESLDVAISLENLTHLGANNDSELATVEGYLRRALAIYEKQAPESLETAIFLRNLGEIVARRGRDQEALMLHRRALALLRRIAPQSIAEAETLQYLARIEWRAGRRQDGVRDFCRSVDVLDHHRTRLGGATEATAFFESSVGGFYEACLASLVDLGRSAEAFHILERSRARSFLMLLAERDLRLSGLSPELAAERRRVNAEYDRVQAELLSAGQDGAESERLMDALRDLRIRQQEISVRIRRESPRSAAIEDPRPLDLAGARAALDPGTVLLEYAVGRERTRLFVVEPAGARGSGLSVVPIEIGSRSLRKEVESFRLLLKNPGSDPAEIQTQARRLYDLLVRPAEARIDGAQRILLSLDGPLHTLPFAALMRGDRFLVEWKPVHSVLSTTVYAELARARPLDRSPGEQRFTAFGDPVYRSSGPAARVDPVFQEAVRRGLTLRSLPFSGHEVRSIAALYPKAQVYLGREATEERAKSIGSESRLVHFACHGWLDERYPLDSGLALTLPERKTKGRDNGLLQAWEIFESVHLDADLVTLSACDTGLGREMPGEGLVGLTRAFQYAGARSVLATLWGVSDRSTARFMQRFYGHLREGKSKDEALRSAQMDLLGEKTAASHPFHWAAFQLTGDWR